ncbi:hypothetical protein [Cryobacterium sp. Hb1]|nr:hypothetical protein [Cryobacterium sp. Hb1]
MRLHETVDPAAVELIGTTSIEIPTTYTELDQDAVLRRAARLTP